MARVIVQRWEEGDGWPKNCRSCDYKLAVHHGIVACPRDGEIHESALGYARLGRLLVDAFPGLRIVSGRQWDGYVHPPQIRHRTTVPTALFVAKAERDVVEVLRLFDPDSWPAIGSGEL